MLQILMVHQSTVDNMRHSTLINILAAADEHHDWQPFSLRTEPSWTSHMSVQHKASRTRSRVVLASHHS